MMGDTDFDLEGKGHCAARKGKFLSSNRARTFVAIAIVLAMTIPLAIDRINSDIDDAYISLRYVYNVLHGRGMIFNPGERIEAISNPTWVWFLTLASLICRRNDLLSIIFIAKFGALFLHLVGAAVFFLVILGLTKSKLSAIFFSLSYSVHPFVSLYAISGLENSFVNLFMIVWLFVFIKYQGNKINGYYLLSALPLSLLSISRPEGLMYITILLSSVILFPKIMGVKTKYFFFSIVTGLFLFLAFLLWRYSYFGEWLSNTAYAKYYLSAQTIVEGIKYLFLYLAYLLVGILPVILFFKKGSLLSVPIHVKRTVLISFLFIIAQFSFVTYAGGDWMPGGRFLLIIYPLMLFIISAITSNIHPANNLHKPMVAVILAITIAFSVTVSRQQTGGRSGLKGDWAFLHYEEGDIIKNIKKYAPDGSLVLTDELGIIPFFTPELRYTDLSGLVNKHISKEVKGRHFFRLDPEYFANLNYDFFILVAKSLNEENRGYRALRYDSILKHRDFKTKHSLLFHDHNIFYLFKKNNR